MPGFDEYKEVKKQQNNQEIIADNQQMNQYYEDKRAHNLNADLDAMGHARIKFDYDADQLMEKFEQRTKNNSELRYRTDYYFRDTRVAQAKAERYRSLGAGELGTVDRYATHYNNYKNADKRREHATTASNCFVAMQEKMGELNNLIALGAGPARIYRQKELIMKDRIDGMVAAAFTKAKSKSHRYYLENRAKLSCYLILKEQLNDAISQLDAQENTNEIRELNNKLKKLQKNIDSAYNGVKKYAPNAQDVWREKKGINSDFYDKKKKEYEGKTALVTSEQTKLLSNLEMIQQQNAGKEWPLSLVLTDEINAPVNKAESKAVEFNFRYQEAKTQAAQGQGEAQIQARERLRTMDIEALEHFNQLHVPTLKELDDPYKYVMNNLKDYYELFKKGLPYYNRKDVPDHVKEYMNSHQDFMIKLRYLAAANIYINEYLRTNYMIEYKREDNAEITKPGKFGIESDPRYKYRKKNDGGWRRENAYGQGMERANYVALEGAYEKYKRDSKSLAEGRPVRKDYDLNKRVKKVTLINDNEIKINNINDKINIISNDDEDNKINLIGVEKINLDIFKNQKDEKKDDDDDLNIIITNKTKSIIEEKKEENKEQSKVNDDVYTHHEVESSLEEAYQKLEDKLSGEKITEEERKKFREVTKARYTVSKGVINSLPKSLYLKLVSDRPAGIDPRGIQWLMRPVMLDKNGNPETKKDAENLRLNIQDVNGLYTGKLSDRKAFLDRIALEAKDMMYSVEELQDHNYIRKDMQRAMKHLNYMHTLINIYKANAGYYLNNAPKEIRNFTFGLLCTEYINYSSFHIQQAIYGDNGLQRPYTGGSSVTQAYVFLDGKEVKDRKDLKFVRETNSKIAGMRYNNGTNYAGVVNAMYHHRNSKDIDYNGELKIQATNDIGFSSFDPGAKYLLQKEYGKNIKGVTEKQVIHMMEKYLPSEKNIIKDEEYEKTQQIISDAIKAYPTLPGVAHYKNETGIIEDLKVEKKEDKKQQKASKNTGISLGETEETETDRQVRLKQERESLLTYAFENKSPSKADYSKNDLKKELEKAKAVTGNKNITLDDIFLLQECRTAQNYVQNPELIAAYNNAGKSLPAGSGNSSEITRGAGAMLRMVRYDKNGVPVSTDDKKNHLWNLKWLENVEGKEFNEQRKMIETEFNGLLDKIELPKPADLDKWVKKLGASKNCADTISALKKCLYLSNIKQDNPLVRQYLDVNPIFEKKSDLGGQLIAFVMGYLQSIGCDDRLRYVKSQDRTANSIKQNEYMLNNYKIMYQQMYEEFSKLDNDTRKFRAKKLDLPTEKDRDQEYDNLCKRNEKFTKSGYDMYRSFRNVREVYNDKNLNNKLKTAVSKGYIKKKGSASLDLSRIPGALLRPVHYDKNGMPIGDMDLVNAAWNDKVMTAFEKGDEKALDSIIKQEIPNLFSQIQIPKPPKNAGFDWFESWFETNVIPNQEKWFDICRRITALGNLVSANNTAKMVMANNREIKSVDSTVTSLTSAISVYLKYKYRLDVEKSGENQVMEPIGGVLVNPGYHGSMEAKAEYKAKNKKQREDEERLTEKLKNQVGDYVKAYSFMFDTMKKENPDEKYVDQRTRHQQMFEHMQKQDPYFSEKSFKITKGYDSYLRVAKTNPTMQALFNKGYKKRAGTTAGKSVDREIRLIMKHVEYDDNFEPISPQDQKNHEWNLKLMEAWNNNDVKTVENNIAEQLPRYYENLIQIPEPTDEELDAMIKENPEGYKEYYDKVLAFFENTVDTNIIKFIEDTSSGGVIDSLRKTVPSVQTFLDDNKKFGIYTDALDFLTKFYQNTLSEKYHIDTYGHPLEIKGVGTIKSQLQGRKEYNTLYFKSFAESYKKYQPLKDKPTVPFKPQGIMK